MKWIALALSLFGCSSTAAGPGAGELVGSWTASGTSGGPDAPGPGWTKTYELRGDGTFEMKGYPPILVKGRWKVAERDGSRFRIVLTEQKMQAGPHDEPSDWNDQDEWAVLEAPGKLVWGDATYSR